MRSMEVMVIGGGASGMMAAIMAARAGAHVMIVEKKNKLGKKLLATGNGKCNFTNKVQKEECYRGNEPAFAWNVIKRFDANAVVKWFDEIGVLASDRQGYVYPASHQATTVLHALEREVLRQKIEIHLEEAVLFLQKDTKKERFLVTTDKDSYMVKRVILATGGKAAPVHGSTGDGYDLANSLGHHIITPVCALTSLVLEGNYMKNWSGIRIQGKVSLYSKENVLLEEDSGEIQLVAYGISGIPVFQISRFAARELVKKRNPYLVLDSMPEYSKEWLHEQIIKRMQWNGSQTMGDVLEGILPDKLGIVFLKQCNIMPSQKAKDCKKELVWKLVDKIKHNVLQIKETSSFEKAQVTAGGVSTQEVSEDTMESKICSGLYLTGELLDIDGMCGGYNLQWAWSSGYLAGLSCGKNMKNDKSVNRKRGRL